jgi:hypothetical protein
MQHMVILSEVWRSFLRQAESKNRHFSTPIRA